MTVRPLNAAARARIQRRFDAIPDKLKDVARRVISDEAEAMADEMKRGAPHDEGDLADSIEATNTSEGTWIRWKVKAGGTPGTQHAVRRSRKGNAPFYDHAAAIEYGHMGPSGRPVPAHPFFWPTYRRRIKRFKSRLRGALKKAIEQDGPGGGG